MDRSKLLRILNKTFPLFRVYGFDVRVHWTLIFFALYFIHIHTRYYSTSDGFTLGITFLVMLYGIVLIHELGHSIAARRLNIPGRHILLSPLGGLAGIAAN